jgi:ribulose-phosphate 3-epimerase
MSIAIHPSILSADFVNFQREFESISEADAIHVDVMDGHFVPNFTFGLPMVKRMIEVAKSPIDVHLMIENVDELAVRYADAGATSVTFHIEASEDFLKLARAIRTAGAKASVAVKPGTSISQVLDAVDELDMILIMTVEPGFGGQRFMPEMMEKVSTVRSEIRRLGLNTIIQVDGGIDEDTIVTASKAGADCFVSGNAIFSKADRNSEIISLRNLAKANFSA